MGLDKKTKGIWVGDDQGLDYLSVGFGEGASNGFTGG